MNNEQIICISCNSILKRNTKNDDFDCYCPFCGSAIHVLGDKSLYITESIPPVPDTMKLREDLTLHIIYERWWHALQISNEIYDITLDEKDGTIVNECAYQTFIQKGALGPAYINLHYIIKKTETYVKELDYYADEMKIFQMIVGLTKFHQEQVYEYMCSHCPKYTDLSDYAGIFCHSAISTSKVGKHDTELKTNPKVIPQIKAFAKYYGFKIPRKINYS